METIQTLDQPLVNQKILLVKRPDQNFPNNVESCFELKSENLGTLDQIHLEPGKILVKNLFLSADPTMRIWMTGAKTYIPPVKLGQIFPCSSIATVIKSSEPDYKFGDLVLSGTVIGCQKYAIIKKKSVQKLPSTRILPQHYLSAFGTNGLTAYFGLFEIGQMKSGETVVISTAAGSVGEIAVQLAKSRNCRVIGIAGGKDKCEYVKSIGADECIDYKEINNEKKLTAELKKLCPKGIDIYFDNVGGWMLDSALNLINDSARIVCCGAISTYNVSANKGGEVDDSIRIKNYPKLIIKRAKMEGFLFFDYKDKFPIALKELGEMYMKGNLKFKEDVSHGIENFPVALKKLFTVTNKGKTLIALSNDLKPKL